MLYSPIPLIRINWHYDPLGYAENPDNRIKKKKGTQEK
jgi:hypothetical protein